MGRTSGTRVCHAVDVLTFTRSGVKGTMEVDKDRFELEANLGFLLGAFKGRIEAEIVKNLDTLLTAKAVKKPTRKSTVA
jgi:putative polyhydroxyalkanoate system protein